MIVVSREMRQSDRERDRKDAGHDFSRWQGEQVAEKATAEKPSHSNDFGGHIFIGVCTIMYCEKTSTGGLSGVVFAQSFVILTAT